MKRKASKDSQERDWYLNTDFGGMLARMKPLKGLLRVHPDLPEKRGKVAERIYAFVRRIPKGKVMTYGQISALLAHRVSARAVGWIMHGAPKGVPWQRVVNAQGGCSTGRLPDFPPDLQRSLLEAEGVLFDEQGKMDLDRYRYRPDIHKGAKR